MENEIKSIDIRKYVKLTSYVFCSIDTFQDKFVLCNLNAELINVSVRDNTFSQIKGTTKIKGLVHAMRSLDDILAVASENGLLTYINIEDDQPFDVVNFSKEITSIDLGYSLSGNFLTLVAFDDGNLSLRVDWENLPKIVKNVTGKKAIIQCKFAKDAATAFVLSTDGNLYIITVKSVLELSKKFQLTDGFFTSIALNDLGNKALLSTSSWQVKFLNLEQFSFIADLEKVAEENWPGFETYYAINAGGKSLLTNKIVQADNLRFILAADEFNNLHFWQGFYLIRR